MTKYLSIKGSKLLKKNSFIYKGLNLAKRPYLEDTATMTILY